MEGGKKGVGKGGQKHFTFTFMNTFTNTIMS
jgi:hypothetical protein